MMNQYWALHLICARVAAKRKLIGCEDHDIHGLGRPHFLLDADKTDEWMRGSAAVILSDSPPG